MSDGAQTLRVKMKAFKDRMPWRALPSLVVTDFDGVLTDNRVLVMEDGREAVFCNRADGLGFDLIRARGIPALILSTERNPVVSARARKLRVEVLQAVGDKAGALRAYCARKRIRLRDVWYVGNDTNDLEVMRIVGGPACPADAHPAIRRISRWILRARGGEGVVRELAERLQQIRGRGACAGAAQGKVAP